MSKLKLAVCTMAYGGQISAHHMKMWIEFGQAVERNRLGLELALTLYMDTNPVDRARNIAMALAMRANADWLLMVDADTFAVRGPHEDVDAGDVLLNMLHDAASAGATAVVAPVMSRSAAKRHPMAYTLRRDEPYDYWQGMPLVPIRVDQPPAGLVPIDSAASAIMAVNLAFAAQHDLTFRFVEATPTQQGLSEDHEFCRQVRAAGGKIFCDTRIVTGHMARPQAVFCGDPGTYAQAELKLG